MSQPKEPHHFARSDRWAQGADAHNALFSDATGGEFYFGESSTTYCIWPEAAERIASTLEAPKVIILMRHPVERALSHYQWMYRLGLESRPFLEAMRADGESFHPDRPIHGCYRGYLAFSRYADNVPRWKELFPPQDLMLLSTSELASDPPTTLKRVHDFLGLAHHTPTKREQVNRTRDQAPLLYRRWARIARTVVPDSVIGTLREVPGLRALWWRTSRPEIRKPPQTGAAERVWLENALDAHVRFYEATCSGGLVGTE
jgi:hypothetical protein